MPWYEPCPAGTQQASSGPGPLAGGWRHHPAPRQALRQAPPTSGRPTSLPVLPLRTRTLGASSEAVKWLLFTCVSSVTMLCAGGSRIRGSAVGGRAAASCRRHQSCSSRPRPHSAAAALGGGRGPAGQQAAHHHFSLRLAAWHGGLPLHVVARAQGGGGGLVRCHDGGGRAGGCQVFGGKIAPGCQLQV